MYLPPNRSLAKSQKLEFDSGNYLAFLNFLSNINSKEATSDPNNIQTDFIRINENVIVLGVKTSRTVAAVLLNSMTVKAELKHQMNFEEQWIEKHSITAFKFLPPALSSDILQLPLLIGANNGSIRIYKMSDEKPQQELNLYRDTQKKYIKNKTKQKYFTEQERFGLKRKFLKLPFIQTSLSNKTRLLQHYLNRQHPIIPIKHHIGLHIVTYGSSWIYTGETVKQCECIKYITAQQFHRKSNQTENFSYNFYHDAEFTFMSVLLRQRNLNLQALFRFECQTINEIEILPFSPIDYSSYLSKEDRKEVQIDYQQQFLIVAMTGLDGFFRIVELQNMIAIFSFRSDFGGFNSFAFNEKYSMVAIAGQDDHIYVVNFQKQISWIKLQGHDSFIGRSIFLSVNSDFLRVVAGGYDGFLSFTELSTKKEQQQNNTMSLRIDGCENQNTNVITVQNKILMNKHGICFVQHFDNFLITLNFDGCISIFYLQNYIDQLDEKVEIIQDDENPSKKDEDKNSQKNDEQQPESETEQQQQQ